MTCYICAYPKILQNYDLPPLLFFLYLSPQLSANFTSSTAPSICSELCQIQLPACFIRSINTMEENTECSLHSAQWEYLIIVIEHLLGCNSYKGLSCQVFYFLLTYNNKFAHFSFF